MLLSTKYKHSYWGVSIEGAATIPSRGVHSPYLQCCYCLIYYLITEAELGQSVELDSAEGYTTLLSDAI